MRLFTRASESSEGDDVPVQCRHDIEGTCGASDDDCRGAIAKLPVVVESPALNREFTDFHSVNACGVERVLRFSNEQTRGQLSRRLFTFLFHAY